MTVFVGKFYHFILYRRAISWSRSLNDPSIDRRFVQMLPYDLVRLLIRVGQITRHLLLLDRFGICRKRKRHDPLIALLLCHF